MSHRIKLKHRITVLAPLPRRNKREALLRRIGSKVNNEADLNLALKDVPVYMREAYCRELAPYLSFVPLRLQAEPIADPSGDAA